MPKQKNMDIIQRYESNNELSSLTIQKLKTLKLNPNPVHYSIMYEYLAKLDPYFCDRVENALKTKTYNNETAETLYITLITELLNLQIPTKEVEQLLSKLLLDIDAWRNVAILRQTVINKEVNFIVQQDLPIEIINRLESVVIPTLQSFFTDTDKLQNSLTESVTEVQQLKNELKQAHELAKTDELTNIPNRRGFNQIMEQVIAKALHQQTSFALIILDLDFFKTVNDTYGHLIGDSTLRYVTRNLATETKGRDYIARLGGEEFAVLLPDIDYSSALKVANNIRLKISSKTLQVKNYANPLKLTVSGGVAMYQMNEDMEQIIQRADKALYHAKNHGRNRICGEESL